MKNARSYDEHTGVDNFFIDLLSGSLTCSGKSRIGSLRRGVARACYGDVGTVSGLPAVIFIACILFSRL